MKNGGKESEGDFEDLMLTYKGNGTYGRGHGRLRLVHEMACINRTYKVRYKPAVLFVLHGIAMNARSAYVEEVPPRCPYKIRCLISAWQNRTALR
jgi:hypothetical protein